MNLKTIHKSSRKTRAMKKDITTPLSFQFVEDDYKYYTQLIDENTKEEVGEFRIGKPIAANHEWPGHKGNPYDLGITINDEIQGKGYAKFLIKKMCDKLKTKLHADEWLYIDTDASEGFWHALGMKDTPDEDKFSGYEKRITFLDLCENIKKPFNRTTSGKKTKIKKKKTKTIKKSKR